MPRVPPPWGRGPAQLCQTRDVKSLDKDDRALGRGLSPPALTTRHLQGNLDRKKTEELLHLGAGTGHCLVFKSCVLFGRKYRTKPC